jgi:hypothetical protein
MSELPLAEAEGTGLVLVGSFNPRIFQPSWFVRQGLLPESVEESANVEIVTNEVCAFSAEWFRLDVLSDRLALTGLAARSPESLRDLLLGALTILKHTPVTHLGVNSFSHYRLATEGAWHHFGHMLAPKDELWTPVLSEPGTRSLTIEGRRTDNFDGHIRAKIEPSAQVDHGVFLEINDEYRHVSADSSDWVIDVLGTQWEESRARATAIRDHVVGIAIKER